MKRSFRKVPQDVTSAININFRKLNDLYRVANPNDIEREFLPEEGSPNYEEVSDALWEKDNLTFDGWAIAKDEYMDELADLGLEYAAIGRTLSGFSDLYLVIGGDVFRVEDELRRYGVIKASFTPGERIRKPKFYDSMFGEKVRKAFDAGEVDKKYDSVVKWFTEYNDGMGPKSDDIKNIRDIITYYQYSNSRK